MSRACRALLTSGSTTVPGANYFVKYVLRVLQHLCMPCNACVRENCVYVPFVNRPFESEIHGTVNFTQFCCVLLVTWCYRVLLSCYLRPK